MLTSTSILMWLTERLSNMSGLMSKYPYSALSLQITFFFFCKKNIKADLQFWGSTPTNFTLSCPFHCFHRLISDKMDASLRVNPLSNGKILRKRRTKLFPFTRIRERKNEEKSNTHWSTSVADSGVVARSHGIAAPSGIKVCIVFRTYTISSLCVLRIYSEWAKYVYSENCKHWNSLRTKNVIIITAVRQWLRLCRCVYASQKKNRGANGRSE